MHNVVTERQDAINRYSHIFRRKTVYEITMPDGPCMADKKHSHDMEYISYNAMKCRRCDGIYFDE